jgi:4-phytase/acid phosphatase
MPGLLDKHRSAFDALQQILGDGPKKLLDPPITIAVKPTEDSAQLSGPFNTASTLSENLLLEYGNGFEGKDLGWGRLNETNLLKVLELHAVYADLMRRTPYLAKAHSGMLMKRIMQALEDAASGKSQDALLVISGHDTNLSNLSGMLGLSWQLPGYQPDDTPPGGALIFSLWRDEKGAFRVRTQYLAQTMSQMHKAVPLTLSSPPAIANVVIPGCETASCNWTAFQKAAERATSR